MKKKLSTLSALSVCISLAINGQASADTLPADVPLNSDVSLSCPADISSLTPEEQAALPENCLTDAAQANEMSQWLAENSTILTAAGATALAATIAMVASSSSGSGGKSGRTDPYAGWDVENRYRGDGQFNRITDKVTAGKGQIGNLIIGNETKNEIIGDTEVKDGGKGNVIEGDNTSTIVIGDTIVEGEGSIGHEIIGDNNELIVEGDTSVSDGGAGTIIRGDDGKTVVIGDTIVEGEGSTGHEIIGDRGEMIVEGDTNVSDGGTGTIIRGDDGKTVVIGDTTVEGEGSTGHEIVGNRGELVVEGSTSVSDGGTGTIIRGDDGKTVVIGDTIVEGEGSTGHEIIGDRGEMIVEGDTSVSDGGTGTIIRGDDGKTVVIGDTTVEGEGATGHEIVGNRGELVVEGNTSVSDGGTGTIIRGDEGKTVVIGDTTVEGEGSTGHEIVGNRGELVVEGNTSVSDSGTGTIIRGDEGKLVVIGDTTVDGVGSVGHEVAGNNAEVRIEGNTSVSNGGSGVVVGGTDARISLEGQMTVGAGSTGLITAGDRADVTNRGDIYVSGEGALGLNITSNDARFSNTGSLTVTDKGTGAVLTGDRFNVQLGGNVLVDAGISRESATGIIVSGNQGVLNISGNVEVRDVLMSVAGTNARLLGVGVSGNGNYVNVDGAVSVIYEGSIDSRPENFLQQVQQGLEISGDGNEVNINGGLNLIYKAEAGITVPENLHGFKRAAVIRGNNNLLTLGGESSLDIQGKTNSYHGSLYYLDAEGENNHVILNESFRLNIKRGEQPDAFSNWEYRPIVIGGEGSVLENFGKLSIDRGETTLLYANGGADVINHGELSFNPTKPTSEGVASALIAVSGGSTVNRSTGILNVISAQDFIAGGRGYNGWGFIYGFNGAWGMVTAANSQSIINEGTINVAGQNAFGISVGKNSNAINSGLITLNAMSNDVDANGDLIRETGVWDVSTNYLRGAAMLAQHSGSLLINTGDIEVHNAGMGMVAIDGTALNQGTINLTADNPAADGLYAMASIGSGMAINDTSGVININTPLGLAFYQTGMGLIINRGTVNLNDSPIAEGDANWGAPGATGVDLDVSTTLLASSGEVRSIGSTTGDELIFVMSKVSNDGTVNASSATRFAVLDNKGLLKTSSASFAIELRNSGTFESDNILTARDVQNDGIIRTGSVVAYGEGTPLVNNGTIEGIIDGGPVVKNFSVWNEAGAVIRNTGAAIDGGGVNNSVIANTGMRAPVVNYGDIFATNGYSAVWADPHGYAWTRWVMNMEGGRISGESPLEPLIYIGGGNQGFYNAGEVSVKGNNAVVIHGTHGTIVNDGVINVGTEAGKADGTNGTGLVGIRGNGASIFNNAAGVINVWADDSHAFEKIGATGKIVNNGTVNLLCDTGCDVFKGSATPTEGDDFVVPAHGNKPVIVPPSTLSRISGYTVGTNADGSAGKLSGRSLALDDVTVDHGFTAGTASKIVTFSDVFKADSITGEENVRAQSVVWNAKAEKNAQGNVDVTMTKNDYAAVAGDASVSNVAAALDKGYTNNALFNSLNVSSASALNSALKQISGAQANSLNKEARVLGQRFNMLAETAPVTTATGLSFNVVAKGDKRAEMDNKVTYDMMALRQQFDTGLGSLSATYGMARLTGSGGNESTRAGDNGLTGGYSQFFGLDHSLAFGETYSWNNSLRADLHTLESRRSISFEGVNRSATATGKQQHLEFRSEGVKNLELSKGLKLAPFAGLKMRHHITDGYKENGAGDFNLSMNRYSETAVDAVTGLRLNYAGENGWGAHATLEAGPNLSFSQSQRKASLQGLQGHQFSVNDGKKSGGMNSKAMAGVNYQSEKVSFGMNAFQWQEDGVADKGLQFNVSRHF